MIIPPTAPGRRASAGGTIPSMSVRAELRRVIGAHPEVRFAYLFGSRATGRARPDSDWDVAIYLDDSLGARQRFRARNLLTAELEEVGPVDVVVLNDADPVLAHRALSGELLHVEDRAAMVRQFVRTMELLEDRRYFDGILAGGVQRRLTEGTYGRS